MNSLRLAALSLSVLLLGFGARPVPAAPLPTPTELAATLKEEQVTVVEPHLSKAGKPVRRSYRGYPARALLDQLLGKGWLSADTEIEFRALDGYVSRVPTQRFARYKAWLVFARADGGPFEVDNLAQQEKAVPLGPFYLVWDNVGHPELIKEGGSVWPYQVAQLRLTPSSRTALLPPGLVGDFKAQAALAQQYCLSCHQINGYGGDKMPLNLAERARLLDAPSWRQWLISPQSLRPGTAMPALPDSLPLAERERITRQLHEYLRALPLKP
ncbi:hypothetical protein RQP53_24240 [Paucibacter sp. APW11]|uniref:Cytochrome c domain-containing protein n=1 Tax=Roseateles aquae TaxID=3077235 RepID=A0ABU3PJV8_9BURK|nr:hypothetical protein [Paucibacter sp. APW11]MDT9002413.1 hypothetical protein [Paucibacter sp. APW11]